MASYALVLAIAGRVLETVQHPISSICQNIEAPLGSMRDIAETAEPVLEKMLFPDGAAIAEGEPDQHLSGKGADPDDPRDTGSPSTASPDGAIEIGAQ